MHGAPAPSNAPGAPALRKRGAPGGGDENGTGARGALPWTPED